MPCSNAFKGEVTNTIITFTRGAQVTAVSVCLSEKDWAESTPRTTYAVGLLILAHCQVYHPPVRQ